MLPFVWIDVELEDCSVDEVEMVDQRVDAFLEYYVWNAVWAWCLVGLQFAGCRLDVFSREMSEEERGGFGVAGIGDERGQGGWGKEGLSERDALLSV